MILRRVLHTLSLILHIIGKLAESNNCFIIHLKRLPLKIMLSLLQFDWWELPIFIISPFPYKANSTQ